jgi:hypothetical protein
LHSGCWVKVRGAVLQLLVISVGVGVGVGFRPSYRLKGAKANGAPYGLTPEGGELLAGTRVSPCQKGVGRGLAFGRKLQEREAAGHSLGLRLQGWIQGTRVNPALSSRRGHLWSPGSKVGSGATEGAFLQKKGRGSPKKRARFFKRKSAKKKKKKEKGGTKAGETLACHGFQKASARGCVTVELERRCWC